MRFSHNILTKPVLDRAKAFLCWDRFPDLSIQLVELQKAVAYFYPPSNRQASIVLFYKRKQNDFSESVFLLFHEVGHFIQYNEFKKQRKLHQYRAFMEKVKGKEKIEFEKRAWQLGRKLFCDFLQHEGVQCDEWFDGFDAYAEQCINTYDFR